MATRKPDGTDSRTAKPKDKDEARREKDERRAKAKDEGRYPDGLVHADERADTTTPPLGEGGAEGGVPGEKPPEGPPGFGLDLDEQAEKAAKAEQTIEGSIRERNIAHGGYGPDIAEDDEEIEALSKKGR
jgi:hypothetical protein